VSGARRAVEEERRRHRSSQVLDEMPERESGAGKQTVICLRVGFIFLTYIRKCTDAGIFVYSTLVIRPLLYFVLWVWRPPIVLYICVPLHQSNTIRVILFLYK
jgi:hypothetical protein